MDVISSLSKEKSQSSSESLVNSLDENIGKPLPSQEQKELNASEANIIGLEEELENLKLDAVKPGQKGLCKSMTFPSSGKIIPHVACSDKAGENGGIETATHELVPDESLETPSCSRSISLPTPLNLVSAMKGSREKQGVSPRKLTVKWAPEVYDPPPTLVSHTVNRGKKQQKGKKDDRRNKQNKRKKGQKGNSSRSGGGSKDKRHYPKPAPINIKCYSKSLDSCDRVDLSKNVLEFDVGNPDMYCSSSFLKSSLTSMHYSVAEAL